MVRNFDESCSDHGFLVKNGGIYGFWPMNVLAYVPHGSNLYRRLNVATAPVSLREIRGGPGAEGAMGSTRLIFYYTIND